MRFHTTVLCVLFAAAAATATIRADHFTTTVTQAGGENWNGLIWEPGTVAPAAGNTYELLDNGAPFGNAQANTRIRNPAAAGLQTFPGDSLTLNTNTEIRAKSPGAILNFPGTATGAGLILKGGVLNAGDDTVFVVTGKVEVASSSFIVPGDNGGGDVRSARGFNLAGKLSGSGSLVIYQAGTNVAQEVSGADNPFTGDWVVKSGYLKGSAVGSLGTGNITIDPLAALEVDPSVTPAEGPALLEIGYALVSPGKLTLNNGGMMILRQNLTFSAVNIEGTALSNGAHTYAELAAAFPNNVAPGGSGSITVGVTAPRFTTKVVQAAGQNWSGAIWEPGLVAPGAGAAYELVSNGTPFGNNLGNTRLRNPASAGTQTFPGDSLTLNPNTELRAKTAGAILNFPGAGGLPGLILNGGVLNAGDDTVFVITGRVQVVSKSYIVPADNGAGAIRPARGFNIAAELSGSGPLVIYQAGTNVAQELSGSKNAYSGDILIKAGWLKGSGTGSLGTGNIVVDPKADVGADPSVTPAEGPAWLEIGYEIDTPGKLTLRNGGQLILHQNATFEQVIIEGNSLEKSVYTYAELAAAYPANFPPGGAGSITVRTGPSRFTTTVAQAGGADWNAAIWEPGPVPPVAGNIYECLENGTPFGNAQNNTRIRNPAVAGVHTFPGDVLILNTNTEIRAKSAGAILNFPGTGGKPGLILRGGVLNAGDNTVFVLTGSVEVASTSFIAPADNGAGAIIPSRGFNISAKLSGSGTLVIYQAGVEVAQEISGNENTFSGDIAVKAGWLKGSGINSLGVGNIIIDPLYPVEVDPSAFLDEGPAQLEIGYDHVSPGKLTLVNGGTMILHQNCTFSAIEIEGNSLSTGTHPYAELIASFPNSFAPDGSGSLTVKAPTAPPPPTDLTVLNGDAQVTLNWAAAPSATGYIVSRSTSSGSGYAPVGSTASPSFVVSGLANGTTYYFVVAATNAFGTSGNSVEVIGRPNLPVTGVTATPNGGQITVNWTALAGASSYTVKRAFASGGPYTNVATGITGTSYVDDAAPGGRQLFYQVVGTLANGGESGVSSEATALTAPSAPVVSTGLFGATTITLQVATSDAVAPQFMMERSTNGVDFAALGVIAPGSSGFTNTDLALGTTYYYRAKAQNASGTSSYSSVASRTTPLFGLSVNFANAINGTPANNPAPTPPGYLQDVGEMFGDRGNGPSYGWDRDITPDGRWRNNAASPDLRYDTFNHLQKQTPSAIWEIEVPNGKYDVHIVSGDATATDSLFQHDVEGVVTESFTPTAEARWGEWTVAVEVQDGRLTVTTGPDGTNNKINFLDIFVPAPITATPQFNNVSFSAGTLSLTWIGAAVLQEATDINGPWTAVAGNPQGLFFVPTTGPRKFYRLIGP